jgi:hypothetical protein
MGFYNGTDAPTLKVQFLSSFVSVSPVWVTVSRSDIRSIGIRRGRTQENQLVQTGTCSIEFDNRSGNYDPDNLSSIYQYGTYPTFSANLPMRVVATWSGVDRYLFWGYLEEVQTDLSLDPVATFTCVDAFSVLARKTISYSAYDVDSSATRVSTILDLAGWPSADRSLSTYRSFSPRNYGTTNALAAAQECASAEFGRLFITTSNVVKMTPYENIFTATNRFTLSDVPSSTTIEYDNISTSPGSKYLINSVTITDVNGAITGAATNTDSIAQYGTVNFSLMAPLASSVSSPTQLAKIIANKYAFAQTRVDSIVFSVSGLSTSLWSSLLQTDLGDACTVKRTTVDSRALTYACLIEGLDHDITVDDWRVSLSLSPGVAPSSSSLNSAFILDNSLLDSTDPLWY